MAPAEHSQHAFPSVRTVKRPAQFQLVFKQVKRSEHRGRVDATLLAVLQLLAVDAPLPSRCVDDPTGR